MIIAQLSDPHIARRDQGFEGEAALKRALAHLLQLPSPPDVLLLTGDLADKGEPEAYDRVQALLKPLPMPVYAVPGNHDSRAAFLSAFGPQGTSALDGFAQYVVEGWPVRLVALDTMWPGEDAGRLDAARLAWLDGRLSEAPERPTLLFMHHPPIETGLPLFDQIGLRDRPHLEQLVARHPQVGALVAGHVHSALSRRFAGSVAHTAGSTREDLLFDPGQPQRLVARREPPRCLLHVWHEVSGLVTHSSLIGQDAPPSVLHDGERWL